VENKTMLRNIVLTSALALAAFVGLAAVPSASAHPIYHGRPAHFARFEVLVRDCGRWQCRGNFGSLAEAERVARDLRCRGLVVMVKRA
jgi:hypothetical protein